MELTSSKMKRRTVTCVATLTAAGLSLGVVACGGSGSDAEASGAAAGGEPAAMTTGGPGPGGGPMAALTDAQIKCLKEEGVNLPEKPAAGETPQPPDSSDRPDPEEMQAAAEACDIDLPKPPAGGEMPTGPPPQLK